MVMIVLILVVEFVFFFKQKTAYEMRSSDWSSDVCSSDLGGIGLVDRLLKRFGLADIFAANVDIGGARAHRVTGDQCAFDQLVRIMEIGRASCRERVCQYV